MSEATKNIETTNEVDPVLTHVETLQDAVREEEPKAVVKILAELDQPEDAADLLEQLSKQEFVETIKLIDDKLDPSILIELRDEYRESADEVLSNDAIIKIVRDLQSDDATTVLLDLDKERREAILENLPQKKQKILKPKFSYDENTAGRLMQLEYVADKGGRTIGEAIERARKRTKKLPKQFYEIYVVDSKNRVEGYVLLSDMVKNDRSKLLSEVATPLKSNITVDSDHEEVAHQFQKYSLASAPVKDAKGRIVGMITVDDMVHVIQDINTEDMLHLANVDSADTSNTLGESLRARSPWLAVNLITAFSVSFIISFFEQVLDQVVALAILMPVVSALGGNAGSQGLAVTVRAIAERELTGKAARRAVRHEIMTGFVNGLMFAFGVGLITLVFFRDQPQLALVIALAMFFTLVWAAMSGVLLPLTLKKIGADPAVASSVFLLTLTDIVAFLSFLGIASLIFL